MILTFAAAFLAMCATAIAAREQVFPAHIDLPDGFQPEGIAIAGQQAYVTTASFDVPTTIDDLGRRLYAVNARFGTAPGATVDYWITQVRK